MSKFSFFKIIFQKSLDKRFFWRYNTRKRLALGLSKCQSSVSGMKKDALAGVFFPSYSNGLLA
jgi:hypothetical protein